MCYMYTVYCMRAMIIVWVFWVLCMSVASVVSYVSVVYLSYASLVYVLYMLYASCIVVWMLCVYVVYVTYILLFMSVVSVVFMLSMLYISVLCLSCICHMLSTVCLLYVLWVRCLFMCDIVENTRPHACWASALPLSSIPAVDFAVILDSFHIKKIKGRTISFFYRQVWKRWLVTRWDEFISVSSLLAGLGLSPMPRVCYISHLPSAMINYKCFLGPHANKGRHFDRSGILRILGSAVLLSLCNCQPENSQGKEMCVRGSIASTGHNCVLGEDLMETRQE